MAFDHKQHLTSFHSVAEVHAHLRHAAVDHSAHMRSSFLIHRHTRRHCERGLQRPAPHRFHADAELLHGLGGNLHLLRRGLIRAVPVAMPMMPVAVLVATTSATTGEEGYQRQAQ